MRATGGRGVPIPARPSYAVSAFRSHDFDNQRDDENQRAGGIIGRMATPATGKGRGGYRPGAGRPKGSKDRAPRKVTVRAEVLPKLAAADRQLPLYRLLDRIADPTLDEKYRDTLCIAVLPYLHARMPTTMVVKPLHLMTDEELEATRRAEIEHLRQVELSGDPEQ